MSKSTVVSSKPTGTLAKWNNSLPSFKSAMLYFPGAMPREKYSPLLLVFIAYLRPVSWLVSWTTAPVIGFPSRSLHTPFTVPVDWVKARVVHNAAAASATSTRTANFRFILASALNLIAILNFVDYFGSRENYLNNENSGQALWANSA